MPGWITVPEASEKIHFLSQNEGQCQSEELEIIHKGFGNYLTAQCLGNLKPRSLAGETLKCSDQPRVSLDNLKLDCSFWEEQSLIDQRSKWCRKRKNKPKWKVWKQLGHFIFTVPTLQQQLGAPHSLLFGFLNISSTGSAKSQKCMGRMESSIYRLKDAQLLWGLWVQCGHPYLTSSQGNSQQPRLDAQSRGQEWNTEGCKWVNQVYKEHSCSWQHLVCIVSGKPGLVMASAGTTTPLMKRCP